MKTLIIVIFLFNSLGFSHNQHVHKYLTTEAYKLLKFQLGFDIPKLQERLGGYSDWYNGDRPWQRGYILTGASVKMKMMLFMGTPNQHLQL